MSLVFFLFEVSALFRSTLLQGRLVVVSVVLFVFI